MTEDAKKSEAAGESSPHVRVMTAQERASYDGVTLEETPDGRAYERAGEERAHRARVSFDTGMRGTDLADRVLRQIVGPHWKWKLGLAAAALVLGLIFFFIALPVLSIFFVATALLWFVGRLLHG